MTVASASHFIYNEALPAIFRFGIYLTSPQVSQDLANYRANSHIGSIYCAAIASEAALHGFSQMAIGITLAFGSVFNDELIPQAENAIFHAGAHTVNVITFGLGAFNPIAGVIVPIAMSIISDSFDTDTQLSTKRYIFGSLSIAPSRFISGAVKQISHNLCLPEKVTTVATGMLLMGGAFYALNLSPLTPLIDFKVTLASSLGIFESLVS